MASSAPPTVPMGNEAPEGAALQHGPWRNRADLSSGLEAIEHFLGQAGFDRAPWAVVALGTGIAGWFVLASPWHWLTLIAAGVALAGAAALLLDPAGRFPFLRQALLVAPLAVSLGCALVWAKSAMVGAPPIARPVVKELVGRVLSRQEQPAEGRVRLLLATREPGGTRPIQVRLNLDRAVDSPAISEGAVVTLRARLVPPAPPMLPGGYDFARAAWFSGVAATGSVLGSVRLIERGSGEGGLSRVQRALSRHVREQLSGTPGALAAAFASGDRGAIAPADEDAMRDAGLTHLLSISGLHVSAVIAAAYFLAQHLLSLWGWLALRVRIPVLAAATGALAGIGYTLLTGAEVPTVRSCVGAVLVMLALVLGREPLSMRLVAIGALVVLLAWPEALVGPSFQMSFAAVIAIVALHGTGWMRRWQAPREEPLWQMLLRNIGGLLLTGVVIELALMPIGLYHFHRAGVYGALANIIAIPLTTFVSMPLIALALVFDAAGMGAPFWWLAGKSLELLIGLAHAVAGLPGAVTDLPAMGQGAFALFLAGGLWLGLWRGRARLIGLAPAALGLALLAFLRPLDVLVSGDGRHLGITGEGGQLLVLRESRSDYTRQNLTEIAGMSGPTRLLDDWPGARCNRDFCLVELHRDGRTWRLLAARGSDPAPERDLAAACERVDLVVAARYLPRSCRPRWLRLDKNALERSGGVTIDLATGRLRTVAQEEGQHGWWRVPPPRQFKP